MCIPLQLIGKSSVNFALLFLARHRFSEDDLAAKITGDYRRVVGCLYLWVCLCIPLLLLGNKSIRMAKKDLLKGRFLCGPCRIEGQ
jgi:hypothetical protein